MVAGELLVTIGVLLLCAVGVGYLLHDINKQIEEFKDKEEK